MTVHQLIGRARFAIERYTKSLADFPDQSGVAMDLELARIALAALTATQPLSDAEQAELQERRKADSEPVATLDVQSGRPDGNRFALVFSSAAHKLPDDVYFLYRHAQPAPVVPDEITTDILEQRLMGYTWADSFRGGWNACRAAMLAAAPQEVK